jgi:hypothetical protein
VWEKRRRKEEEEEKKKKCTGHSGKWMVSAW